MSSSSSPPAPRSPTTGTSRASVVVDEVMGEVALDGERAFSRVRVGVAGAVAVLWPLITLLSPDRGAVLGVEAVAVVALVVSLLMWASLRRQRRTSPLLGLISVLIDLLIAASLGAVVVLQPPQDFVGLMHVTGFSMIYVAVAGAGIRLSRRVALVGGLAAVLVVVLVHLLDRAVNPQLSLDGPVHLLIGALLIAAATAVAVTAAQRTREVALSVARQTLLFERARHTLGAYVSTEVAEHAMQHDGLRLGGTRQRVAILFTDLRGFTSLSEDSDPEALVRELNEYFEHMVRVVRLHGGVVDKYIGDSIMAVFGAPTPRGDDAARAIQAAAGLQDALVRLNEARRQRGLAPLAHGVGVHVGDVVAGNIGTADRAQYTVIGDAVNVAARLESATKAHHVEVLVSADAIAAAGTTPLPALREVGTIQVKGRAAGIPVSTLA
jgi:class 3 adenylate cyclase